MANAMVAVKLTWDDNSTGALDETGQEIEIWTDSPSFVPNISINYMEARHPWMRLPPIAAGVEEAIIQLKAPVTFVKFRVRQYNANGNGAWTVPQTFSVTQVSGSAVPPAPTNLGMILTGDTPTPPDLPTEEPPDTEPPPTGGGGSSSNYTFQSQFSGVQGQNQWSYGDSVSPTALVYNATDSKWNGDELYLAVWGTGFRHSSSGGIKDCVVTWTAPAAGDVVITGSYKLFTTPGSVTVKIQHNGVDVFSQDITDATVYPYSESFAVLAGDTVEFITRRLGVAFYNNNIELNPNIQLTTGGVPVNPTVGSLSPSVLSIAASGVGSLLITLSSAPSAAAVVSLSSSDVTKATVPATVTVPAGQTTAIIAVTGVAAGGSTITATYNSTSKQATISVSAPVSGSWSNAPIGGVVLLDQNCSNLNGLFDVYGSTILDSDATAPLSAPTVLKARLEALALYGGNQLEYNSPTSYREMYFGLYWRTNPQYQGRIVGNKMFFLSSDTVNGCWLFHNTRLSNGAGTYMFSPNSAGVNNAHILGTSDPGAPFFPNVGNGTLRVGVWYKLEGYIKASTSLSSRDGILKWWINDVLVGSYLNINYCGPAGQTLNKWVQTQTWDGSGDMGSSNTVAWEHYIDHLRIVGKN